MPSPAEMARTPLVIIAVTAPSHTTMMEPNRAATVAAVICPTSPHSEKKITAKETTSALPAPSSRSAAAGTSGLRHNVYATQRKLVVVTAATIVRGRFEIACPTNTAAPIFAATATDRPQNTGSARYRDARMPV